MNNSTIIYRSGREKLKSKDLDANNACGNHSLSGEDMQEMSTLSKGQNRIHKPIALLFWIDCKNGNKSRWTA